MRNMSIAVLALAISVGGCSAEVTTNDGKDKSADKVAAGPSGTQSFALTGFTGVTATGPDDVTIRQGSNFSIQAKGAQKDLDELEITLDGETLSIGRKSRAGFSITNNSHAVQIEITLPKLHKLRLTGSGSIDADTIDGDAVEAVVTGSGDLKIAKLTGKSVKLSVTGSGDLEIAGGTVGTGDYGVTGSGNIDADALIAQTLKVSIAGSGDVDGHATGTADVSIMGSGDAVIAGGGKCTTSVRGSGTADCK